MRYLLPIFTTVLYLLAMPASAVEQAPPRIAFLSPNAVATGPPRLAAFREAMRDNGLIEGKHDPIEERDAAGDYQRFHELTRELLQRHPALILVSTIESVRVARQETRTIPIVMTGTNDAVGSGLVASLVRPGGNTTGLSTEAEDTVTKYVQSLREAVPRAKRIAVLINPDNPSTPKMFEQLRTTAGAFGKDARAFEAAFGAMCVGRHERISAVTLKNRIPVFAPTSAFVEAGSLVA